MQDKNTFDITASSLHKANENLFLSHDSKIKYTLVDVKKIIK